MLSVIGIFSTVRFSQQSEGTTSSWEKCWDKNEIYRWDFVLTFFFLFPHKFSSSQWKQKCIEQIFGAETDIDAQHFSWLSRTQTELLSVEKWYLTNRKLWISIIWNAPEWSISNRFITEYLHNGCATEPVGGLKKFPRIMSIETIETSDVILEGIKQACAKFWAQEGKEVVIMKSDKGVTVKDSKTLLCLLFGAGCQIWSWAPEMRTSSVAVEPQRDFVTLHLFEFNVAKSKWSQEPVTSTFLMHQVLLERWGLQDRVQQVVKCYKTTMVPNVTRKETLTLEAATRKHVQTNAHVCP